MIVGFLLRCCPGNDTVSCQDCPPGGDCSGAADTSVSLDQLDPFASVDSSGVGLVGVIQADAIVAAPGYWASQSSNGLKYYACPIPAACQVCVQELVRLAVHRAQCTIGHRRAPLATYKYLASLQKR